MTTTLDILAIDIDAAIRKLTEKRFKNRDEPALALIRLAAATAPAALWVTRVGRQLTIETRGGTLDTALFDLLSQLFDPTRPSNARSLALGDLEHRFGLDVLAAFAGAPRKVAFAFEDRDGHRALQLRQGGRPLWTRLPPRDRRLVIEVTGGLCRKGSAAALAEQCRFADIPIFINGRRASQGVTVEGTLIRQRIVSATRGGVVGIPREGDLSRITLLDNGVISDELYMPAHGGVVFHATVTGKRSDVGEIYPPLRRAAKRLLGPLAEQHPALDGERRRQAEIRLFERYEVSREPNLVRGVYAFRTTAGERFDLPALQRLSAETPLFAIDESAPSRRYATRSSTVLILSRPQRRFLDAVLDAPLKTPPKHVPIPIRPRPLTQRLCRLVQRLARPAVPLPEPTLTHAERCFLEALRQRLPRQGVDVAFANGRRLSERPLRRDGAACYLVPRQHPAIPRLIADVLRDSDLVAPALALITAGAAVPEERPPAAAPLEM